jgi:acyl-CoA synthetase (AMP-forming)/AMP-acid ligase II
VAVNTLLTSQDYLYMLQDSRAQALLVSAPLWPVFEPVISQLKHPLKIISDKTNTDLGYTNIADLIKQHEPLPGAAPTLADDVCFWLYSSGSTGSPKGTVHLHSHIIQTAELYGRAILGLQEDDVVFSAAKLFFAYGLGNALSFPLAVGATTVLLGTRPTPADVFSVLQAHQPTVFYGVPTFATLGMEAASHHAHTLLEALQQPVALQSMGVGLLGAGLAWVIYTKPVSLEKVLALPVIAQGRQLFVAKWGMDDIQDGIVQGGYGFLAATANWWDTYLVDGVVNGAACVARSVGQGVRCLQSGQLQAYLAFMVVLGAAVVLLCRLLGLLV